jgi:hypothetical protein
MLETAEDAANVLDLVRWRRDQNTYRKIAAQHAVLWCTKQLHMLQAKSCDEELINTGLRQLRISQTELSAAMEELSNAHRDVSTVRTTLRRKRLPIPIRSHNIADENLKPSIADDCRSNVDVSSAGTESESGGGDSEVHSNDDRVL